MIVLSILALILVYNPKENLLNSPILNLAKLQETIQTHLPIRVSENFLLLMKSFLLIIIGFIKQTSLEYDIIGIELEFQHLNPHLSGMDNTPGLELVNKQDAYSQDINHNPYRNLDKTIEAQQHMNKIRANWIKEYDPDNRHVTNMIRFNSYMNQAKGFEDRLGVDNGPGGKHTLRFIYEPLGCKVHVHGGYIAPGTNLEVCTFYSVKEFNPLPFPLQIPFSTQNYPYQGLHMLDGIATRFDSNWSPEVKQLFWKATECNNRAASERILAGHYPLHDNKVVMHDDMSKIHMENCWKLRFNRDLHMNELNKILENQKK